jgi:predicted kinase
MRLENKVIGPYSIIAMVGPSGCGKSTWVNKVKEEYPELKVVSSDEERYEILGINELEVETTFRYSNEMLEASESAFHILQAKVEAYCKLGIQHVLVDTTGTPQTIEMLGNVADRYGYNKVVIVMSLPTKELKQYAPDPYIFERSLKKFQKESVRSLKGWTRLDLKDREALPVLIEESPIYLEEFSVIGDLHQRIHLVNDLHTEGKQVFLGDYFDLKDGTNNRESVESVLTFLEELVKNESILLKGNHENYIHYRLTGGKPCDIEPEFFNSVAIFLDNKDLAERFLSIYEYMMDYARIKSQGVTYYLTHAPCSRKYRCKPGRKENFRFRYESEDLHSQLKFLSDNAPGITISGHISHNGDTLQPFRNRYLIDTGSTLTALVCKGTYVRSVRTGEYNKELPSLLPPKELSPEVAIKVDRILDAGGRFISGTMSPAPSKEDKLESIEAALEYFTSKGITEVLLDEKMMGSRCNAYVSEDTILLTSRAGVPIDIEGMESLYPNLQLIREKLGVDEVVLDGELMPWATLGEGLVQEYEAKLWIYQKMEELGFPTIGLAETQKVLSNFSSREEPYFIPFSILEMKKENVTIWPEWDIPSNEIKELLGAPTSTYLCINTNEIDKAIEFFNQVVEQGLEGIVIRPIKPEDKAKIPYMKLRERDYLRLLYGPDYTEHEAKLASWRNIDRKIELSVKEWLLGKEMLSSSKRRDVMVEMLGYMEQEQTLDPRL